MDQCWAPLFRVSVVATTISEPMAIRGIGFRPSSSNLSELSDHGTTEPRLPARSMKHPILTTTDGTYFLGRFDSCTHCSRRLSIGSPCRRRDHGMPGIALVAPSSGRYDSRLPLDPGYTPRPPLLVMRLFAFAHDDVVRTHCAG